MALAALTSGVGGLADDAWRLLPVSRSLSKMGHAQKHFKKFQKLDSSLSTGDVAKILEYARKIGVKSPGPNGSSEFVAKLVIGSKSVLVKVIESSSGLIKSGYPL